MDKINAIAKKHNLKVVEDACQAWLAEYKVKKQVPWATWAVSASRTPKIFRPEKAVPSSATMMH